MFLQILHWKQIYHGMKILIVQIKVILMKLKLVYVSNSFLLSLTNQRNRQCTLSQNATSN